MQTPKKYSTNQKIDIILEPATLYNSVTEIKPKESEDLHPVLVKLIEKSKKNFEQGLVISHEEVMLTIKKKYPFL